MRADSERNLASAKSGGVFAWDSPGDESLAQEKIKNTANPDSQNENAAIPGVISILCSQREQKIWVRFSIAGVLSHDFERLRPVFRPSLGLFSGAIARALTANGGTGEVLAIHV